MKKLAFSLAALLLTGTSAQAATIVGLCNTGANTACTGNTATPGGADEHWTLSSVSSNIAYVPTNINGAWLGNTGNSLWVTPSADGNQSFDPGADGLYAYTLNFDLGPALDAASAMFSGRFAADNTVDSITLNGNTITGSGGTYNAWTDFAASSGFVVGANTLTFNLRNYAQASGNPTGLRVEFLSSSVTTAVPEPASWALMIVGFGLVGGFMRRRTSATLAYAA